MNNPTKEPKYIFNAGDHYEFVKCPVCGYKRQVVNGKDEGCPAMCDQTKGEAIHLGELNDKGCE